MNIIYGGKLDPHGFSFFTAVKISPTMMIVMNTAANKQVNAFIALEKAMEVRRLWMQALSGKISKEELDAKGIRFMSISE